MISGGTYQGILGVGRSSDSGPEKFYGVTPENYKITGMAVDKGRRLLCLSTIKFMVPDVGGLGWCCENIQVIDSSLLTNKFLARRGYAWFASYLQEVDPDVIETHCTWAKVSGIYSVPYFNNHYSPIVFENNLLWVKDAVLTSLLFLDDLYEKRLIAVDQLVDVRYGQFASDRDEFRKRGIDVVIGERFR